MDVKLEMSAPSVVPAGVNHERELVIYPCLPRVAFGELPLVVSTRGFESLTDCPSVEVGHVGVAALRFGRLRSWPRLRPRAHALQHLLYRLTLRRQVVQDLYGA